MTMTVQATGKVEFRGPYRRLDRLYDKLGTALDHVLAEQEIALVMDRRPGGDVLVLCEPGELVKLREDRVLRLNAWLHEAIALLRGALTDSQASTKYDGETTLNEETVETFLKRFDSESPEALTENVWPPDLAGHSVGEVLKLRDACDAFLGAGNCWKMGCRDPVPDGKTGCERHSHLEDIGEDAP